MRTEHTLTQLQLCPGTPARARELGQMGYMQWLAGLPPHAPYAQAARHALTLASPFEATDPAVGEFCALLRKSLATPLAPLDLALPQPRRRGGARMRRLSY
jgi:hypothetical protein